jgi:hypothetical protein
VVNELTAEIEDLKWKMAEYQKHMQGELAVNDVI